LLLAAGANPRQLFFFLATEDFAAIAQLSELAKAGLASDLVVHYKEISIRDGFIVTAFPMSTKRMNRTFSRWRRLR
jgi:hypothetical protein